MTDEYLKQLESGNIKSTEEQIKEAQDDYDLHVETLEDLHKQVEHEKAIFDIVVKNPKPLELTAQYQEDEEYWTHQKEIMKIEFKRKINQYKMQIKQLEKVLKSKKEELDRMKGE